MKQCHSPTLVPVVVGVPGDTSHNVSARLLPHVHGLDRGAALSDGPAQGESGLRVSHPGKGCKCLNSGWCFEEGITSLSPIRLTDYIPCFSLYYQILTIWLP